MAFNATLRPSGHAYAVPEGETLLQAALDAGLAVPYGCRNGACGACKGKVIEGRVDLGGAQDSALSAAERDEGVVLFCCARPLTDVVVECREVRSLQDIPVRTLPCRVQRMERLASDVMVLHLKLPANERLQYMAGQYVEFLLKDGKRRAFSVANAPHDDEMLELHVRLVPGGRFTGHVFSEMKERDILRIEGPHGSFYLREESRKPAILLAGGTGFAPIKALVEHAIHNHLARPMHVYWGARDRAGLYLPSLGDQWAAAHAHIEYVPVLSDPTDADAWPGRTGLV
ncbi:MAG: CDP-6-deoxy-delta-3,4-glucoseen reductase, partial [Rhodocyclaceae bacterium]|nr:CDP-6-deoxy-delta-3,4-glucoseen reductase [Rhodocyclaceae bacterium]